MSKHLIDKLSFKSEKEKVEEYLDSLKLKEYLKWMKREALILKYMEEFGITRFEATGFYDTKI